LSFLENPDSALDRQGSLHSLFEQSAAAHPERCALECRSLRLSYAELDAKANQFARFLNGLGIGVGSRVCLLLPKTPDLYVAMLGALKAGAAYVPLDLSYPQDRVQFIAEDCQARLLVSDLEHLDLAALYDIPKLFINEARLDIDKHSRKPLPATAGPDDEAYVIYTSGTTGKPKGVPVSHGNVFHFVRAEQSIFGVCPEDRILQGFSVAFDASLEEIWLAFGAGATLVAAGPEIMHAGPDLGRLLAALNITVLSCVPTLAAMIGEPVDSVRLLILGGEALPDRLAVPWFAPTRRIYNTYGPTEATVVATLSLCRPGEKITIGRPLPNYTAYILGEDGRLLGQGEEGELAIGGLGVTLGYLHRPELTARQFIENRHAALTGDASPVLYRTGDLARIDEDGNIEYLGRIDTQVKIRGFRVELGEIESLLLAMPGVSNAAAAVRDDGGHQYLAAYVILAADADFDESAALAELKKALPLYMVPAFIEPLAEFPVLTSGKLDRKALPLPQRKFAQGSERDFDSATARLIYEKWLRLFDPLPISEYDDFFLDLGGHSLLAAQFVSDMRRDSRFADLSMGDVYTYPSINALAAYLDAKKPAQAAPGAEPTPHYRVPAWKYFLSGGAQTVMVYFLSGFFALQWLTPFAVYSFMKAYEYPFGWSLGASFLALFGVYPAMFLLGVLAKWLVLGRLRAGDYPVWGSYYVRWLFVQRLLNCLPMHYLSGTPLFPWYLRLLGSRIGRDAQMNSHQISGLDLLTIGDHARINADANISCYAVEDGYLKVRPVVLGDSVSVGIRSVLGQGVAVGDGAVIADLTCIPNGASVGAGEYWSGSPAVRSAKPEEAGWGVHAGQTPIRDAFAVLFYLVCFFVLPATELLPIFPGIIVMYELDYGTEDYSYLLLAPMVAVLFVLLSGLQTAILKWLLLGRLKPGVHPVKSFFYMRKWVFDKLMEASIDMLRTLYATLYLNPWYRLLGVKVGKAAEVSTASFILPDLLHIGDGSFIADGVGLGPAKLVGDSIVLKETVIGDKTFIGNSAYVPVGSTVGDNCLLGCLTSPPGRHTPDGTSWLGSPAVHLPQRQKPTKQFAEERTYKPTRWLYALRYFIEFFRVILPGTAFIVFASLILSFSVQIEDVYGPWVTLAAFPALYMVFGVASTLLTALMKLLIVGRYKPDEQPLWSTFVWRTELMTGFCENFTLPFFAQHLQGTMFMPWYYRMLGMKIGRRACILTTDFTEFDLVTLGDDVALNEESTIQTHLFEDRVMKMSTIEIGSRVSIGSMTLILYGTVIEDDVKIGDLSLLMKGERLYRGSEWAGSPVRRC
jgi:non-ribosomal peptide synthetase-like protein